MWDLQCGLVYLNGHYVGYSQGSNNVAEFDLIPYLRSGENKLAVQVFRWWDGSYLECQDMFRMSGIFRDVYLYRTPKVAVCNHYITVPRLGGFDGFPSDTTVANIRITMDNRDRQAFNKMVAAEIYAPDGCLVAEGMVKVSACGKEIESGTSVHDIPLPIKGNIRLWSAECPELYTVRIIQYPEGETEKAEMAFSTKYGFRHIGIRGALVYLNGVRTFFKGVNRHAPPCTGVQ